MKENLNIIAKVLFRSFLGGTVFLCFWAVMILTMTDWVFNIHSNMLGITKAEFYFANYLLLGFFKLSLMMFFLLPFIAIKMVEKKLDA